MSNQPKQFRFRYSSIFQDESVVRAYQYRPQYPNATFDLLADLLPGGCRRRTVLDAGGGTGFVARPLAPLVDRVDAVDFSAAAIREGMRLPEGGHARLRWVAGPIETAAVDPPYCLITAGMSLHWFDWETAFPRFARLLEPDGLFVAVGMRFEKPGWMREELGPVLARYSMNQDFKPFSEKEILDQLEQRGLFRRMGSAQTEMIEWRQPVNEWVESIHARNGFSRDRMDPKLAAEADAVFKEIASRHAGGREASIVHRFSGTLVFGKPLQPDGR